MSLPELLSASRGVIVKPRTRSATECAQATRWNLLARSELRKCSEAVADA